MGLVLSWLGNDPVLVLVSVVGAWVGLLLLVAQVGDQLVDAREADDRERPIVGRVWLGVCSHEGHRIDDVFVVALHELLALVALVERHG